MRSITFILAIIFLANIELNAQDSLSILNHQRNEITLTGMKVLGSWGVANIGVGSIGWATSKNDVNKHFYQMSTLWGAVNTGVAILGYSGTKKKMKDSLNADESLKAQQKIERTFLINGGLDLAYIGTGIYLNTRGNNSDNVTLKGYGSSVLLQGIFLLVFDGTMYSIQKNNGKQLQYWFNKNAITFSGKSIGLVHYF